MHHASRLALPATAVLLAVLACCPLAFAQPGPSPGEDPVSHAQAYAQRQVEEATADPTGYVQRTATPEGVANATNEAAYTTCWLVYETTDKHLEEVCGPYFTPPGEAERPADLENATVAPPVVDEAANKTLELANTTVDAVQKVVEDPTSAPSQVERVAAAVVAFVQWLAGGVVAIVRGILDGLGAILGALGTGFAAAGLGILVALEAIGTSAIAVAAVLGQAFALIGSVAVDAALAMVGASVATLDVLGQAFALIASVAADGAVAALHGMVAGAQAVGNALAVGAIFVADLFVAAGIALGDATVAVAGAVSDATVAVADAVADAAAAVADAVGALFGGGSSETAPPLPDAPRGIEAPDVDADGLLDGVTSKLPA